MRSAEARTTATRLGSYEILHKLATGGMAELFLARSVGPENFQKLVVLKKILPGLAENEKFVQLFLDEARLVAGLDHPHIAHVYDLGRVDGSYFFTMEHVYGRDIRAILHRSLRAGTPWPIEHAVHVARTTLAALHYAHERCGANGQSLGLVHRDVSPSNIMIAYDGVVKLLDFGVAKVATSTTKTRTGSLKGKVSYMSPEQAKGAAIDRRSDIFSLGIVLWEMLAMQRLFKADNDLATLQLIINKVPDAPSTVRDDCPAELDRIVLRALSQDPAVRYQTAQAMQLEIEELAREAKLNQSSIALGEHMNVLFAKEIDTWKRAQAQGVTLEAHLVASAAEEPSGASEFLDEASELGPVEDDDEKTERTQPPKVETPAPPPKKKKKRIRDHAIAAEPSIVVEPSLDVEVPVAPEPAPAPAERAPAAAPSRPSARALADRPRSIAQRRRGNTLLYVLAGGVLAGAAAVAFLLTRSNDAPSSEPVAPAKIEIPLATPQPAPPAPAPPPAAEAIAEPPRPPPPPPAAPPPPLKATPKPVRHHVPARPAEKPAAKPAAAPKYDPNAALPPM